MLPRCFWSFVKEIPLRTTFFEPSFARSLSMETMSSSPYSLSIRSLPSRKEASVILGRKGRIDAAVHPAVIGHGRVHNKEGIVFFELFDELFYIVYMDFGAKIS